MIREGVASLKVAKALIDDEKIDAQLQVSGRMRGAWTVADYAMMTRDAQALQRDLGMAVDVLSKTDVRREVAADCYQGGLLFHAHGGVHPALFHLGLLQRVRTAGALVAGHTPVTAVRGEATKFIVETARGSIDATEVIATTNGYTGRTTPPLARHVVAIPTSLIPTEPVTTTRLPTPIP